MQLARGARLTEVLKQPQYEPLPVEKQIAIIFAATNGFLDDLELSEMAAFEQGFHEFMETGKGSLLEEIREKREISDDLKGRLEEAVSDYKHKFKEQQAA